MNEDCGQAPFPRAQMGLFSNLKGDKQDSSQCSSSSVLTPELLDGVLPRIKSEYYPKKQAHFDILADASEECVLIYCGVKDLHQPLK